MMKLQEGKYYRTRDGRKVGPITVIGSLAGAPGFGLHAWYVEDEYAGRTSVRAETEGDLVAEWTDEPVEAAPATNDNSPIRTRRVIVPGDYGGVVIEEVYGDCVSIDLSDFAGDAPSLREAAHLFNQIAEVLEEQAGQANAA